MTNSEKRERITELCKAGRSPGEIVKELGTSHATVKKVRDTLDFGEDSVSSTSGDLQNNIASVSKEPMKVPVAEVQDLIKAYKTFVKKQEEIKQKYNVDNSYIRGVLQKPV